MVGLTGLEPLTDEVAGEPALRLIRSWFVDVVMKELHPSPTKRLKLTARVD